MCIYDTLANTVHSSVVSSFNDGFLCIFISYQKLMTESSRMPLFDLRKLNASLPAPPVKDSSIKVLVLGAQDDFIVVKLNTLSANV